MSRPATAACKACKAPDRPAQTMALRWRGPLAIRFGTGMARAVKLAGKRG